MIWTILILLIVWFIFRPIFRILFGFYRLQKQVNNIFSQQQKSARESGRKETQDTPGHQKKKKIIDPSVGEYVDFVEIKESEKQTSAQSSYDSGKQTSGSNIEDVEWEDIKE